MKLRKIVLFGITILLMACGGGDGSGGGSSSTPGTDTDTDPALNEDTLTTVKRCYKITGGLYFQYVVNIFSDNDKFITCSVTGGSFQVFQAVFYKPTFAGHVSEACILTADADTSPTGGFWIFSVKAGVRTAVYNDATSRVNGATVTFSNTTDCTTN